MRRFLPLRLLDLLVLKDLLPFFLTGIALFSGLWFAADPLLKAGQYLSGGVPFWLVVRVVGVYLPYILAFTLPMAMLLAVLQGFGRLSGDSEAVALYAGGIPFVRIAAPAAAMGLAASLLGYYITDRVASAAEYEKSHLEQQITAYAPVASSELIHEPLYLEHDSNGNLQYFIQVQGGVDARRKTMRKVTVLLFDPQGLPSLLVSAQEAYYQGLLPDDLQHWVLKDATTVDIQPQQGLAIYNYVQSLTSFRKDPQMSQRLYQALNQSPSDLALLGRDPQTLDFAQKRRQIALMIAAGHNRIDVRAAENNYWSSVALPFSALVFTLIGAPLGMRSQRSSRMTGWFLAILIIFGYYVLTTTMSFAARGGVVPPVLAAFLPHVLGLVVGGCLIWRASR